MYVVSFFDDLFILLADAQLLLGFLLVFDAFLGDEILRQEVPVIGSHPAALVDLIYLLVHQGVEIGAALGQLVHEPHGIVEVLAHVGRVVGGMGVLILYDIAQGGHDLFLGLLAVEQGADALGHGLEVRILLGSLFQPLKGVRRITVDAELVLGVEHVVCRGLDDLEVLVEAYHVAFIEELHAFGIRHREAEGGILDIRLGLLVEGLLVEGLLGLRHRQGARGRYLRGRGQLRAGDLAGILLDVFVVALVVRGIRDQLGGGDVDACHIVGHVDPVRRCLTLGQKELLVSSVKVKIQRLFGRVLLEEVLEGALQVAPVAVLDGLFGDI